MRHASSKRAFFWAALSVSLLAAVILCWSVVSFYRSHFLPRTSIGTLSLDNLTPDEVTTLASQIWSLPADFTLTLVTDDATFATPSSSLAFHYEISETVDSLFAAQSQLSAWQIIQYLFSSQSFHLDAFPIAHDHDALITFLQSVATTVDTVGRQPSISYEGDKLLLDPGQQQISLDYSRTFAAIQASFPDVATISASLTVSPDFVPLTPSQASLIENQATTLLNSSITLTTDQVFNYSRTIPASRLLSLLLPDEDTRAVALHTLYEDISATVSRQPQEPILEYDLASRRATRFVPPLDGLVLDETQFSTLILDTIHTLATTNQTTITIDLPLAITPPAHSLADVNDLGIAEMIGFGESYYAHSIPGRVHNVATAASRVDGTLVAPGEEFSFNRAVGDVSATSGYQEGYIIQGGRSVLSAGGGVCQVSTTVFRALLDSGLQITLRRPHSYRVTYYELSNDPGFDATVYTGNVDLRFINDTDHYVLITATTDSTAMYMYVQIWGTSDGRTTTITDYKKFNAVAAPPPEYIEDPSLAPGQVKQIDWAVGGLETNFTHTIYNADGSIRSQKQYPSKYQAWSAKYLVGPSQ